MRIIKVCKSWKTVEVQDFWNVQDVAFLSLCESEDKSNMIPQYSEECLSVDKA